MNAAPYELAIILDPVERRRIAVTVLADLPRWFGRPEVTRRYVAEAAELPLIAARDDRGLTLGFVTLRPTAPAAREIHVMGVMADHHIAAASAGR